MTVIAGTCSRTEPPCSKEGVARCVTCKTWYCSAQCQADHWPRHWRECLPLPDLEWLVQDDQTQKPVFVKKREPVKMSPLGEFSDQVVHVGTAKLKANATFKSLDTKEPTETNQTKISCKMIDIGSADSSLQGETSSTPVKTSPETSAPKDSAPVTVSVSSSKPDDKGKSSESPAGSVGGVQVTEPPSQANPDKGIPAAPSVVVSTTSQAKSSMYTEAQYSSNLPSQTLTKKVNEIVSPLDVIESPSNFIVRLADAVRFIEMLIICSWILVWLMVLFFPNKVHGRAPMDPLFAVISL